MLDAGDWRLQLQVEGAARGSSPELVSERVPWYVCGMYGVRTCYECRRD